MRKLNGMFLKELCGMDSMGAVEAVAIADGQSSPCLVRKAFEELVEREKKKPRDWLRVSKKGSFIILEEAKSQWWKEKSNQDNEV